MSHYRFFNWPRRLACPMHSLAIVITNFRSSFFFLSFFSVFRWWSHLHMRLCVSVCRLFVCLWDKKLVSTLRPLITKPLPRPIYYCPCCCWASPQLFLLLERKTTKLSWNQTSSKLYGPWIIIEHGSSNSCIKFGAFLYRIHEKKSDKLYDLAKSF